MIEGTSVILCLCIMLLIEIIFLALYWVDKNETRRFVYSIFILILLAALYALTMGQVTQMNSDTGIEWTAFINSLSIHIYQWFCYSMISLLSVIGLSLFMIELGKKLPKTK